MDEFEYTRMVIWLPDSQLIKEAILNKLKELGYQFPGAHSRTREEDIAYVIYTRERD